MGWKNLIVADMQSVEMWHGANQAAAQNIMFTGTITGGLADKARQHVHCSPFPPGSEKQVAGQRFYADYGVKYECVGLVRSEIIVLWVSQSVVILTDHIISPIFNLLVKKESDDIIIYERPCKDEATH